MSVIRYYGEYALLKATSSRFVSPTPLIMAKKASDTLRDKIVQLQKELARIEAEQAAVRTSAVKFLKDAVHRLGVTMDDLEQEIGTRAGRAGRVVRSRLVKERKALTKRGRKAVRQAKKVAKKAGARAVKAVDAKASARAKTKATKASQRRGVKVAIKYRGPNSGETWTGRGKLPRWLSAYIAQGKTKAEFLVK